MGCCISKPDEPDTKNEVTDVNPTQPVQSLGEAKEEVRAEEPSTQGSQKEKPRMCDLCASGPFGDHFWFFTTLQSPPTWIDEPGCYTASVAEMDVAQKINPSYVYNTNAETLDASAKAGCPWCMHISFSLKESEKSIFPEPSSQPELKDEYIRIRVNVSLSELNDTPTGLQKLRVEVTRVKAGHPWMSHNFMTLLYAEFDDPAAEVVVARPLIRDVASSKTVRSALRCISECQQNHERCRHRRDNVPSLPTRVIDCLDPLHPKLVATSKEKAWYTTLSYCWGEPQPHQTRLSNIATYFESLDITHFPQTIKDAIVTTHALGIRYVWVDSLCIIQDSAEDKIQELGDMARIYADAYLTIIAASAQKVSEGFLQLRTPRDDIRPDIPVRFPCPNKAGVGTVHLYIPPFSVSEDTDDKEPIDKRAWCFQERLVSPRSLVYTSETLEFHCLTSMVGVGDSILQYIPAQRLPDALFAPSQYLPPTFTREEWSTIRAAWKSCLLQYMRRSITNSDDKLVAMSSVAERFHRVFRTQYLAGVWRETLISDLCWLVPYGGSSRPSSYRAPSWSWAAVDHGITVGWQPILEDPSPETETCEVISCEVALKHDSLPFGEVASGTLVLHAPLFKAYRHLELPAFAQVYLPGYDNSADPGYPTELHSMDPDDDPEKYMTFPPPEIPDAIHWASPLGGPPLISSYTQDHSSIIMGGDKYNLAESRGSLESGPFLGTMSGVIEPSAFEMSNQEVRSRKSLPFPSTSRIGDAAPDCAEENDLQEIYIALLRWNKAEQLAEGLILVPAVEATPGLSSNIGGMVRYRRVGYFTRQPNDPGLSWMETVSWSRFEVV